MFLKPSFMFSAAWRIPNDAWALAGHTISLDVWIQLTLAMCHMATLSVVKGKHSVVEQGGRLSKPFAALFLIVGYVALTESWM